MVWLFNGRGDVRNKISCIVLNHLLGNGRIQYKSTSHSKNLGWKNPKGPKSQLKFQFLNCLEPYHVKANSSLITNMKLWAQYIYYKNFSALPVFSIKSEYKNNLILENLSIHTLSVQCADTEDGWCNSFWRQINIGIWLFFVSLEV